MTEELYLYTHFEPKARVNAGRQTFIEPTMDPDFLEAGTECLSMQEIREDGLPDLHSQSGPAEPLDLAYSGPVLDRLEDEKPQAKLQANPKKKSKSESKSKSKSKSRSKSKSKSNAEPKPVGKRTSSLMPQYTAPNRDLTVYPALPADATPEKYVKDKEFAMTDNTRDVFLTSGRTMESLSANRAYTICKARLIAGKYGVTARKPCDFCKARNRTCRIMHPALHTEPWHAVKPPGSGKTTNRCACCSHLYKAHCNAE
ncbi:hypothetical protein SLS60_002862 [Paraconiothyrium brasiliense]|uniref:Uncharacterized protein n=1 Tax=Paraconiothyrium brasiliense TaxID=300254 RepID=A0ABR3RUI4_9PLEO